MVASDGFQRGFSGHRDVGRTGTLCGVEVIGKEAEMRTSAITTVTLAILATSVFAPTVAAGKPAKYVHYEGVVDQPQVDPYQKAPRIEFTVTGMSSVPSAPSAGHLGGERDLLGLQGRSDSWPRSSVPSRSGTRSSRPRTRRSSE